MNILLTLIIFFPALAALCVGLVDKKDARTYAIFVSVIELILTLIMCCQFDYSNAGLQLQHLVTFIPEYGINYHVAVDGISLFLVVLSSFMTLIAFISLDITDRIKHMVAAILFLEMTMLGVFLSLDAVIFYAFWELSLIPMLYMIGIWGRGAKIYAAVKFFIYTFVGSIFMLVGIILMAYFYYQATGIISFNIIDWYSLSLPVGIQNLMFIPFFIAFAVKTPVFPFHTWLPYAHGQAPTVGSVLLAAVLLKMGTYGFIRFSLPFFPDASYNYSTIISILAVIMVIYISFVAYAQKDIKQVIAYSSVAHMGVIMLGIFSMNAIGITGAIFLMISHGVISGGLFMLVGYVYHRTHTLEIKEYGGLAKIMPKYSTAFGITMLASIGLPLTMGFVGEFLSLLGMFESKPIIAFLGGFGIIMGAVYTLTLFKNLFFGEVTNKENLSLKDMTCTEKFAIFPILAVIIFFGIYPKPILHPVDLSVKNEILFINTKVLDQDAVSYNLDLNVTQTSKVEVNLLGADNAR